MKKIINVGVVLFLFIGMGFLTANPVPEGKEMVIHLRLYEGFRSAPPQPEKVVSSYYLKQLSQGEEEVRLDADIAREPETLKRVFNLTGINLMTQATLGLQKESNKTPLQVIVLNGRKLLVQLSGMAEQSDRFLVEVLEEDQPPRSLLETKINLPEEKSTVLGFEDSGGHIYFLSFRRYKDKLSSTLPGSGEKDRPIDIKNLKKPRLIHKVDPKFPEEAKKSHIEGRVVIEATTNNDGDVVETKVLEGHPLLSEAAVAALKQWKYEPYYVKGRKRPVHFTVVMNFQLDRDKKDVQPLAISAAQKPKLIKHVDPEYPREAVKAGVQGKVVIEATIDTEGKVVEATVIDGNPMLNPAALAAIRQWVYEPYITENGTKKSVKFTVVANFKLQDKKSPESKK